VKKLKYSILCLLLLYQSICFNQVLHGMYLASEGYYIFKFNFTIDTVNGNWTGPSPGDLYMIKYKNRSLNLFNDEISLVEGLNIFSIPKDSLSSFLPLDMSLFSIIFLSQNRTCLLKTSSLIVEIKEDTILILEVEAQPVRIHFEKDEICENDLQPIAPILSAPVEDIHYYSYPYEIDIDVNSGVISPFNQYPGTYIIHYSSDYCLENNTDTIVIHPKPVFTIEKSREICKDQEIELIPKTDGDYIFTWSNGISGKRNIISQPGTYIITAENEFDCKHMDTVNVELKTLQIEEFDFEVSDADCYNPGGIHIKKLETNGELPFTYQLLNQVNNQVTRQTDNLREGDYLLTVIDASGCKTTIQQTISIKKECLNDNPVFSPNTDGKDDDYFIPYVGEALVYDRNGIVRNRFTAPAYWDGKDNNGNPLPMGTYVIVVGKKNIINITIVK